MPWLMREVMVTKLRSRKPSLSVRLHTSPKRTSSLSSANFGANSPNWVRPAVCLIFSCAMVKGMFKIDAIKMDIIARFIRVKFVFKILSVKVRRFVCRRCIRFTENLT